MKISKLFHWLYAILMLLPILIFIPNAFFYGFNEHIDLTGINISDSMINAWNSVWNNTLFSWSYGSFLTEPFTYIGNLFGIPLTSTIYYALSYWLTISIIWLCFDLVMYIPLLVHRWLDKGIIE